MEIKYFSRPALQRVGVEGLLATLFPLPFILAVMMAPDPAAVPPVWRLAASVIAGFACLLSASLLQRKPRSGRAVAYMALSASAVAILPFFGNDPVTVFVGAVLIIGGGYALSECRLSDAIVQRESPAKRSLERARWSAWSVMGLILCLILFDRMSHTLVHAALATSTVVMVGFLMFWVWRRFRLGLAVPLLVLGCAVIAGLIVSWFFHYSRVAGFFAALLALLLLPDSREMEDRDERWWRLLLGHPARVLLSTFLGLCGMGTLSLLLPGVTTGGRIDFVNAAFTSVSAVCVTGLTVLDTARDFSVFGQALILLLIQLGGLGIMSITTVGLYALGKRLSLSQERLMTSMTDTDHHDLVASLVTILRFTFLVEGLGGFLLSGLFYSVGDSVSTALWRGFFTAVSAFCNAGFALQSTNLMPYQHNSLILHVVAFLIIAGGLAPATSLLVPRWIAGRTVPVGVRLSLVTTGILLLGGTFAILAFEWNGILAGLSVTDKLHNAWFQSVTLRTAGFNSVDLVSVVNPTCLIMICLMFIGGSPGGTAGGVKTTTIAILVMTFWASVTGRSEVIVQNRRIPPATINRAVTIVSSGALIWLVIVLMLEATQQIPARDILFEVTSALATVGLTIGATSQLDEMGKLLVMLAMFVGRIGPMTLFMLLSEERSVSVSRCLDAKVSLT